MFIFFFKQKTAYEMRISDWSSDVCSSDLWRRWFDSEATTLRLRAITASGPYGADIRFASGLNVIWADNTKGKSTCMQAMLYALGLEKMLSPRREVPLPHAMTTYLRCDDERSEEHTSNSNDLMRNPYAA